MRFMPVFASALICVEGSVAAAQPQPTNAIVQVGVFGYRADGSISGFAYDTDLTSTSTVFVSRTGQSICGAGAGRSQPPENATDAWQFSGKVLSSNQDEVVLLVEWQRTLESGRPTSVPGGSPQLTLRAGDRVLLDSMNPPSHTSCWTTVGFEARYMPRLGHAVAMKDGAAVTKLGDGSGRASGGGIGRITAADGSGGGAMRFGRRASPSATLHPPTHTHEVNLWLVRSAPGKADEVMHQTVRTGSHAAAFAFSPVTSDAASGSVVMQVTGSVAVTNTSGTPQLVFETRRHVRFPAGNDAPVAQGFSRTEILLPGPDEVLSFELPPLTDRTGRQAVSDRLAIRARITPR